MPIVHIYLLQGRPQTYLQALGDSIHQALMETWGLPENDRFQIFHEKKAEHFKIDRFAYLVGEGVQRSDDVVVIQITTSPRTIHMKRAFYKRLPELLKDSIGLSPANVFINVMMTDEEDWSLGMGKMTLIEKLEQYPERVTYVASAFLRLCVSAAGEVERGRFSVINTDPQIMKVYKIAGLDSALNVS